MKNSLFFIVVISTLFGGVLEYYGPGERMLNYDPSSIGLGDAYHFGGNIIDVLMAPLNNFELTLGFISGSIIRGIICGIFTTLSFMIFLPIQIHSFIFIYFFNNI